jgi:L-seryl-tRNA(Ser) seleniumtransferase
VDEVRRVLGDLRDQIRSGQTPDPSLIESQVEHALAQLESSSLRHVINATGVVLHTNLGRAPLARFEPLVGYSNLEYNVSTGSRGKRDVHVGGLLERLTGAPGIAVNNNAAAVFLALNELAAGQEVIVSRGELIEIGDGFRIPDIMSRSGAVVREVGTTNRTRIEDYREAINDRTRLLLRVHPSNFSMQGFTAKPDLRELAALGKQAGIPVYEDLGSGCVVDLKRFGIDEPLVSESLAAGASVVSFSGDKLLGGPQAGILVGEASLIARLRRNPLFRALRLDKLIYQALEITLRNLLLERWEQVPALAMIAQSSESLRARAEAFLRRLDGRTGHGPVLQEGRSVVGGGSTPDQSLPAWLIALECKNVVDAERRCRAANPPVVARIEDETLLFDLRTVFPWEEEELLSVLSSL